MNTSKIINQTLEVNRRTKKTKKCMFWALFNVFMFVALFYDLYFKCPLYTTFFQYCEFVLLAITSINLLYFIGYFSWSVTSLQTLEITEDQRKLLGVKQSDPNYKVICNKSRQSNKSNSLSKTDTNISNSSLLGIDEFCHNSKTSESNFKVTSLNVFDNSKSPNSRRSFRHSDDDSFLSDPKSLRKYLENYDKNDDRYSNPSSLSNINLPILSFLTTNIYRTSTECQYQNESFQTKKQQLNYSDIWRNLNIENSTWAKWNHNLKKINYINKQFLEMGLKEIQVGSSSLDRLKRTLETCTVSKHIVSLKYLIPFLEITQNQEYLVKRLRELTRGGTIAEFIWDGGSTYNDKPWTDHLPTDSEIVLHMLMTYLDSQLHSLAPDVNLKPFSTVFYLNEAIDKPTSKLSSIYICEKGNKPPHYTLVVDKEVFDFLYGRKNLFHVILFFLYHVNKKEHGMLGRVNLGKSGINMLCIIENV